MMLVYLLKSVVCMVLFLSIYRFFLEGQKIHRFNRFFLLSGLIFSLLVPLLSIEVPVESVPFTVVASQSEKLAEGETLQKTQEILVPEQSIRENIDIGKILIALYAAGVIIFCYRFGRNLLKIKTSISTHEHVPYKGAWLVLLPGLSTPYSFLNYIFVNREDHNKGRIENQLFTHELTHVHQKHTADVLFIEIIKILFWFNPVLVFYKRAIQLNHEFLADDCVLRSGHQVSAYQHLLLKKTLSKQLVYLTSSFNYGITKKRLTMMITKTSRRKAIFTHVMLIPMVTILFLGVTLQPVVVEAEVKAMDVALQNEIKNTDRDVTKAEFLKDATIYRKDKNGKYTAKKYEEMSDKEQAAIPPIPPVTARKAPTKALLHKWAIDAKYGIWIDDKRVKNSILNKYITSDFSLYNIRFLTPKAINYLKFKSEISIHTNAGYQRTFILTRKTPGKILSIHKDHLIYGRPFLDN